MLLLYTCYFKHVGGITQMNKTLFVALATLFLGITNANAYVVFAPSVPVYPINTVGACQSDYNFVVNQEQYGLQQCAQEYWNNSLALSACQQQTIEHANLELNNDFACRDYYLQMGWLVIFTDHGRHFYHPHPRFYPGHHEHHEHERHEHEHR